MERQNSKHLLILCSLNREDFVFNLLKSLRVTKIGKDLTVIFVESSNNEEYLTRVRYYIENNFHPNSKAIPSAKGLVHQRNLGVEYGLHLISEDTLVHFLDDDVTVDSEYFSKIEIFFNSNKTVFGGGARIANLYKNHNTRLIKREYGKIGANGLNTWIPDDSEQLPIEVEWIPGCCMIFRSVIIKQYKFNINLENGPMRNYAIGEDIDFTWRVSRVYKLSSIPSALIEHHLAPSKRDNLELSVKGNGVFKAYMHRLMKPRIKLYKVMYVELLMLVVRPTYLSFRYEQKVNFRLLPKYLRLYYIFCKFFLKEFFSKKLDSSNSTI